MKKIQGIGISEGRTLGKILYYSSQDTAPAMETLSPEAGRERFLSVREKVVEELTELGSRLRREGNEVAADLMEMHGELAEDPDFEDSVLFRIGEGLDPVTSVREAGEEFALLFEEMEGEMQLRAADIRDVAKRIAGKMAAGEGEPEAETLLREPVILLAEDLSPSELATLDREKLLGVALERGSAGGHTAILCRSYGIPAVIGLRELPEALHEAPEGKETTSGPLCGAPEGKAMASEFMCGAPAVAESEAAGPGDLTAILDGKTGILILDPDPETRDREERLQKEEAVRKAELQAFRGRETVTKDGRRILLYCNISSPADLPAVLENDGEGIGLFRSEFLYLNRQEAPTEEEQFEVYREVLTKIKGEVIIRTLDIGADKTADYLKLPEEENPALGLRGLRLCLRQPDLLRTQLRALYRASVYGKLRILFPMVTSLWEVERTKKICRSVIDEFNEENVPLSPVPLGIMIETPAAALISDQLAPAVDFFSVGTNDLTQYTLACDRTGAEVASFSDPHHEAVFRLLELTVKNAHAAGIRVGICGELAADREVTKRLLELGVDEFSVAPRKVLELRAEIMK